MSQESQESLESQHSDKMTSQPPLSNVTIGETTTEPLDMIREEQSSQTSIRMYTSKMLADDKSDILNCICRKYDKINKEHKLNAENIEKLLKDKESELRAEYDKILEKEKAAMNERFDYILANEQTRASYMLREAHRERQEKINALQSQLQCKNLAALMYVMCTERKRSKLEKLKIVQDYTNYIHALQDILAEGQELILHLSRGYKTAARVDHEWREKMKKVVGEFLSFIYHFAGGSPETNQYFIDLPNLLKTKAPIVDNPAEDPCEAEEEEEEEDVPLDIPREKSWWEQLDAEHRPFVMFGDLADSTPAHRREVLHHVKARKTAPKWWKQYAFNDMFLKYKCEHMANVKDLYPTRLAPPARWECHSITGLNPSEMKAVSKQSLAIPRCLTGQSVDIRGNMGSLLKIITSANAAAQALETKTALLGARDSIEIASTTKLRNSLRASEAQADVKEVVLNIGKNRVSVFEQSSHKTSVPSQIEPLTLSLHETEDSSEEDKSTQALGSLLNDSLQMIQSHVPDHDHKINYEKVCPMEECQRLQVDSFMRSLPPYMRANPFTHFENTFEEYETCTPEQLEMLKQRIEVKKVKEHEELGTGVESPLQEWRNRGVAVQTSELSLSMPPCTCHVPSPTPVSSNFVFNFEDLIPVKQAMDAIQQECLFDNRIDFDRFKLIGQDGAEKYPVDEPKKEFKEVKYEEIKSILKKHPSLLDIFQANTRC